MATASQPPLNQLSPTDPLSSDPSDYDTPRSDCESIVEAQIPVIDLSLLRGTQEQRSQAVRDMGRACQEWGFFMAVNHGMPEGLRGAMLEASEEFFVLPNEVKKKYTKNNVLDPVRFGIDNSATNSNPTREFLTVIVHPEFTAPANPPGFRDILQEYMTCTRELARELVQGIWESLELDGNSIDDNLDLNSCLQIFNGNFYPPCPQPEVTLGIPPHSDLGLLTVLLQNGIDGLQVKHNDRWVNVKALPNSFFINTGEHMEVVNHGMPEGLRGAMLEASQEFFNQPSEVKKKYTKNDVLDPIRFGIGNSATNSNPTGEELLFWREFLKVIVHPEFTAPANPPGFREILQEYMTCTRELAKELLQGIWESLELNGNSMNDNLDLNSCFQIFNGNFYPPCPHPEFTLGLPPHSDIGLLTVLLQNRINGLQVKHNDRWVNAKALPNSFFINIGEHMEIISNGRYKSVMHRATLNDKSTRISVVSAIGPSMEATIVPAPELVTRDNHQARYRAMKFGDYISYKFSSKLKEKLSALDSIRLPVE